MADLTAIILTLNEEKNIERCIRSLSNLARRIVVVDSGSTDSTVSIAKDLGAEIIVHPFINQAKQYIWGESTARITTKWTFRIDADESLTDASREEIEKLCNENTDTDINGIVVRFRVSFMGKELKHGGIYPFRKLLIYKTGMGYMEDRSMDEHIVLNSGRSVELKNDSLHHDYKDLSAWIDKHNKYSSREVIDYNNRKKLSKEKNDTSLKSFLKFNVYYRLPMGTRAFLYYVFRYYFKLGFLDGKEGRIFAFLQAYWYRFLVDAKIYESEKDHERSITIK